MKLRRHDRKSAIFGRIFSVEVIDARFLESSKRYIQQIDFGNARHIPHATSERTGASYGLRRAKMSLTSSSPPPARRPRWCPHHIREAGRNWQAHTPFSDRNSDLGGTPRDHAALETPSREMIAYLVRSLRRRCTSTQPHRQWSEFRLGQHGGQPTSQGARHP